MAYLVVALPPWLASLAALPAGLFAVERFLLSGAPGSRLYAGLGPLPEHQQQLIDTCAAVVALHRGGVVDLPAQQ